MVVRFYRMVGSRAAMKTSLRFPKLSESEAAFYGRIARHIKIGFIAGSVPFAVSAVVLATGNSLSRMVNVDPHSFLFQTLAFQ